MVIYPDLEEPDYETRLQFCHHILHSDVEDVNFFESVPWADELKFTREGFVIFDNLHYLEQFSSFWRNVKQNSVSMWLKTSLLDHTSHLIPLVVKIIHIFLQNDLPVLLEDQWDQDRDISQRICLLYI